MHRRDMRRAVSAAKTPNPADHLLTQIVSLPVRSLTANPRNARRHPREQIASLAKSIAAHGWTIPLVIDERREIICGHGRLEAAKSLGLTHVPTLTRGGLSEAAKRALAIADNRIAERAAWDLDLLKEQFKALIEVDFDVELSGFTTGEIDILLDGSPDPDGHDPDDELEASVFDRPPTSQAGDLWLLGRHRLLCGDALDHQSYLQLLGEKRAQMIVTDSPYNVKIQGHARGRGRIRHREFQMASGEMSGAEFQHFLSTAIGQMITFSTDGSLHFLFMDWRHLPSLLNAALPQYAEWKQLLVWNKPNGGQGSFYRSKHELIAVFKHGHAPHVNTFGLGSKGRYRTNVLDYPGGASLDPRRQAEQDLHPTVKPVALIADLMRDCSRRNDIVLDPFAGSGTVFVAAERAGRAAFGVEIDPAYIDVAIDRWQRASGQEARLDGSGATFAQVLKERANEVDDPETAPRLRQRVQ